MEGPVTLYREVVSHLLEMYAIDDMMAERDADMILFTHPSN